MAYQGVQYGTGLNRVCHVKDDKPHTAKARRDGLALLETIDRRTTAINRAPRAQIYPKEQHHQDKSSRGHNKKSGDGYRGILFRQLQRTGSDMSYIRTGRLFRSFRTRG
jgi:hypothetical protein